MNQKDLFNQKRKWLAIIGWKVFFLLMVFSFTSRLHAYPGVDSYPDGAFIELQLNYPNYSGETFDLIADPPVITPGDKVEGDMGFMLSIGAREENFTLHIGYLINKFHTNKSGKDGRLAMLAFGGKYYPFDISFFSPYLSTAINLTWMKYEYLYPGSNSIYDVTANCLSWDLGFGISLNVTRKLFLNFGGTLRAFIFKQDYGLGIALEGSVSLGYFFNQK